MEKALRLQMDQYASYLASDPDNINLIHKCADLYLQLGEIHKARELVYRGLQLSPGQPALTFLLSSIEMADNHPDVAIDILKSLLNAGIDNGGIRYNLAYAYGLLGDMEKAKEILSEKLEQHYSEYPTTQLLLARIHHHLGNMDEVISGLNRFLQDHPDHAEGNGNLALAYADMENYEAARTCAQKSIEKESSAEGYLAMGVVELEDTEPEKAVQHFTHASKLKQNSGRALMGLGLSHMMQGNLVEGEKALIASVQLMPSNMGAWISLAWAQIALQKLDAAEQTLNKAMAVDRNFSEIYGTLAVIQLLRGEMDSARINMRRAYALDPDSFTANYVESVLLAYQGQEEKAKIIVNDAMQRPIGKQGKTLASQLGRFAMKRKNDSKLM